MKWKKIYTREYSVQYQEVAFMSVSSMVSEFLDFVLSSVLVVPEHGNTTFYAVEEEFEAFFLALKEKYSGDLDKFLKFKELFHCFGSKYVEHCKGIATKDFSGANLEDLKKEYLSYQDILVKYSCFLWIGSLLNIHYADEGRKLVEKLGLSEDVIEALFLPVERSTVLLMQDEARLVDVDSDEQVSLFHKKYEWIQCLDLHKDPWALSAVKGYISNIGAKVDHERISFSDACSQVGLLDSQIEMFKLIKELGYIKDVRDDYRREGIFYARGLFLEISRRFSVSLKQLAHMTQSEILRGFDAGEVESRVVNAARKRYDKGFTMKISGLSVLCSVGLDEGLLELEGFEFVKVGEGALELSGICASKGKVQGRVVIVHTIHDILKVKKGDVLVAFTTHPDYLPAMQLACAIVTQEGGLLSHAAIVSRELKIPCVVSVKGVMDTLCLGEKVEVDADKGVVRRLDE